MSDKEDVFGMDEIVGTFKGYNDGTDKDVEFGNRITTIMNIFQIYFQRRFLKGKRENMFKGILQPGETNHSIESFFDALQTYQEYLQAEDTEHITMYKPEDFPHDDTDEIYVLQIDKKDVYLSKTIYPLLEYLATIEWSNIDWDIKKAVLE